MHANKLSLNVVKTQSLIIGSGPNIPKIESQPDAPPSFSIGDQDMEMITGTRCLGVQIDSKLNWDKHIDNIKSKANRALGLIKYSTKYLPSDVLNKMYRGIFEPIEIEGLESSLGHVILVNKVNSKWYHS